MIPSDPFPVTVYPFESPNGSFTAYEIGPPSCKNAIIYVGGLSDGPHTIGHVRILAKHLEKLPELSYSIFEVRITSSFIGWGVASLAKDVEDISALVKYLRSLGREKIVIMGHSTGCQDCMEYTNYEKHSNEPVDGFILQGPISDRESMELWLPDTQPHIDRAAKMIADGCPNDCLPASTIPILDSPVTAYRFHSLATKGGDDDYFSSDLDDETISKFWGRFKKPVLVLHSGEDECVPSRVNQEELSKKYRNASTFVSPLSGLIPGASHSVESPEARDWLADRMVQFLRSLED